jgi:hypothetical protein
MVILVSWKTEIGRIMTGGQQEQKVKESTSQSVSQVHGGIYL